MTCRNIVFIPFIFLEVYRASWFYGLISFISFETFSTITSSSINSVHSFFLSLLICKKAEIWQVITTISQSIFMLLLFHLFASQIFKIHIFSCISFSLLIFYSAANNLLLKLLLSILMFLFLCLEFSFGSFKNYYKNKLSILSLVVFNAFKYLYFLCMCSICDHEHAGFLELQKWNFLAG